MGEFSVNYDDAAWAEVGRKQGDQKLREEIAFLRERIVSLEKILGIYKEPEIPRPTEEGQRQPGVKW